MVYRFWLVARDDIQQVCISRRTVQDIDSSV